jgi:hypothetical protein
MKSGKHYSVSIIIFTLVLTTAFSSYCIEPKAEALPKSIGAYTASYSLYWHGVKVGKSEHVIEKISNTQYMASSHSTPMFSFYPFENYEKSEFIVEKGLVRPLHYIYQEYSKGKMIKGSIAFNWKKKIALMNKELNKEKSPTEQHAFSTEHPIQDKITHFFQLREDLRARKLQHAKQAIHADNKSAMHYTVLEPSHLKQYPFEILGEEKLKTEMGDFKTIVVLHTSENKERVTKLWLAEELDYIIVKLEQTRKGKLSGEARILACQPK